MRIPISVVIFTRNEEANIRDCILSASEFSETLIIDSESSDRTVEIANSLGIQVVSFKWNGEYPKKRQWSLENVTYKNNYILFLDADERISASLREELRYFITKYADYYSAGSISIDYYFAGKQLKYGQRPKKIVLLRLGKAQFPAIDDLGASGMGELEGHYQPIINGKTRKFKHRIIHKDHDLVSSWMNRHVNYANWEAHLLINRQVKRDVDVSKGGLVTFFHKIPFRPLVFFFYSYFFKFGFLDGKPGFDYAFAKSWYYWLSRVIAREKYIKNE